MLNKLGQLDLTNQPFFMRDFLNKRMKKRILFLGFIAFMMQCSSLQLMGQDIAIWEATDLPYNTPVTAPYAIGDFAECQVDKGAGSSAPASFTNHFRLYVKNTMTIRPLNGASITKVEFTCKQNGNKTYLEVASVTPSDGSWTDPTPANSNDTVVATWEGALKNTDLVFTMSNAGQRMIFKIVVTYTSPHSTVYQVTYKPNGGVGDDVVVSALYGTTMTVMENPFDRDEFVFDTWNTEADGQGDEYTPGITFELQEDLDLYAQWTTSPDLLVDVFNPTNVNAAIGSNLGYSEWTINLPDSEHPRITYQGKSAKNANSIQMNSSISGLSAYTGIATTFTNNLKAKKVKVTWSGSTSDGGTLLVYGKDTPYSGPSDLYGDTQGTLLGSIVKGTSAELDISAINGIYPYIGLRSSSGAIYLDEIRIIWETLNTTAPVVRIEPTSVNLGNVAINNPLSVDFTVSQANLTDDITLQLQPAMGAFSIGGETVTTIPADADPTVVTWTYTPTTAGVFNVLVTATSTGSSSHLNISGTVLNAAAQTLHESKAAFVADNSQNSACINLADVEVIAQSANYLYLQDSEAGLLVYGGGAPTLQTPCKFTAGYLQGTFVDYHGIIELQNFQFVDAETTQDMVLTATTASVDEILASPSTYDSRYVQLNNVNIDGWTLTGTNGTLAFHDRFQTGYASKTAPDATDPFTVKALLNGYYASGATGYQIDPIALADIHTTVKAPQPSVSPEGTASNPSQATTVIVAPPFNVQTYAVYYYKINDGEFIPFTTWTYINLFDEQTTLTVYGTRDFYENSNYKVTYYVQPQNTHTVKFSINGVISASNNLLVTGELQATQTPNVTCLGDFGFVGWSLSESSTETITMPYPVNDNITLYAVYAKGSTFIYKKVTNVSQLVDGEYVIIADSDNRYTIKNASSTHSPTAYGIASLGISINSNGILEGDLSEVTWNFTGSASNMQITSTANPTNHLFIIGNSSTGVRVGHTSENTSWSINEDNSVVSQFNMMSNNRYLVVYNNQDWRSYTNMNNTGSSPRMLIFRKQAVIDSNSPRFTRVFWNETATGNIDLVGPAIVPSGYYLNMNDNNMTNATASNFIIEDGASFKLAYGNTGIKATVKKDIVGYVYDTARIGWHLLSSPVGAYSTDSERVPQGLLNNPDYYDLYGFDQSQEMEWRNVKAGNSLFCAEQGGLLYANKFNTTVVFSGDLTASVQFEDLTYVPNKRLCGWNIVGNPYTSAGYLNVHYNEEGMAISDYYRMRDVSENGKKFSKLIATSIDTPVDPMEGVFVQAPSEGFTYRFVNSNRGLGIIPSEYLNIKVSGSDGEVMDMARVRFNEGCLMGKFDFGEGGSQLYIPQGGKKYAVVPTQCHGELPINFKAAQNGTYTMEFDLENAEMDYLHLIDNKTGVDVDLLQTPTYTFDATRDDYYSRFRLLFEANGALGDDNFAYYDGSVWMVTGSYDNATVQVIDMMGRVLSSQTVNGSAELNINHAQGVYVLRLINNNEIKTQKIIVR